jgi:hypothetical protein
MGISPIRYWLVLGFLDLFVQHLIRQLPRPLTISLCDSGHNNEALVWLLDRQATFLLDDFSRITKVLYCQFHRLSKPRSCFLFLMWPKHISSADENADALGHIVHGL